ncbi:MAG: MotA/TolQ/ExbB proton channel family protein [Deltaproteobacteria bacterium]|nr:MotA/TolQ/ExbB proton channel family protein [Deltaproteobacteria bacterium]
MSSPQCPHCDRELSFAGHEDGEVVDCVHCGRSFALPGWEPTRAADPDDPTEAPLDAAPRPAQREPRASRRSLLDFRPRRASHTPTDVGLISSGLVALVLTVLFYAAAVRPLSATYFGELFGARGWVPYVITLLSMWSVVILTIKYRRLNQQLRVLDLDLVPASFAERITPADARVFASYLRDLGKAYGSNLLLDRVLRALRHFSARQDVSAVVTQINNQAQIDSDAVESSYTMLRVFVWAIPILGFIGTVMGIGQSVSGFSDSVASAVDLDVMKYSIGAVTTGLGVAFDTTLLALVMSIVIMLPTSTLQKAEEDFLSECEHYCDEHLVRRLDDGGTAAGGQDARDTGDEGARRVLESLAVLGERASASLRSLDTELSRLSDNAGRLERRLAGERKAEADDVTPLEPRLRKP